MGKTIINLPGKYKNKSGNPKWDKFIGFNQLSYSTHEAFKNPEYRGEWMAQKFVGLELPQPLFAKFGNCVGQHISGEYTDEYLNLEDKRILDSIEHPQGSEFEREIVIDMEPFGLEKTVFIGFIDRCNEVENVMDVLDFKTGSVAKKKAFYSGKDYQQLNLYSYGLEQEGYTIGKNTVALLDRGGNSMLYGAKYPLRLKGDVEYVERTYSKQEAEDTLKDVVRVAKEIDTYYKTYNKYFG